MRQNIRSRKATIWLACAVTATLLLACELPLGGDGASGGAPSVANTLASLPVLQSELPQSINPVSSTPTASVARASGDVSELPSSATDRLFGEGWSVMVNGSRPPYESRVLLNHLRTFAETTDIVPGEVYSPGVLPFGTLTIDVGSFMVEGTADDLIIYWHMEPALTDFGWYHELFYRIAVTRSGAEWAISFEEVATERWDDLDDDVYTLRRVDFDSAANTTTFVAMYVYQGVNYGRAVWTSYPEGGAQKFIGAHTWNDQDARIAGWANDSMGATAFSDYDAGNMGFAYVDFYDSDGLIQILRGRDELQVDSGVLQAFALGENIAGEPGVGASPPAEFFTFVEDDGSDRRLYLSADDTLDIGTDTMLGTVYSLPPIYFRANSEWTEGDVAYHVAGVHTTSDGMTTTTRTRHVPGFSVPGVTSFAGFDLYFTAELPLRRLLPLQGSLADATVRTVESGTSHGTIRYMDGTYEEYTEPSYSYFVDANDDQAFDDSIDFDLEEFRDTWFYTFGEEGGEVLQFEAPHVVTTVDSIPEYFTTPDQSIIAPLTATISDLFLNETAAIASSLTDYDDWVVDLTQLPEYALLR